MKEEDQYQPTRMNQPLLVQEPANTDESQAIHKVWLTEHYAQHPPKRLAARAPDEPQEDAMYVDGELSKNFPSTALYVAPVKRPRGRPRKHPLPVASFAHTS